MGNKINNSKDNLFTMPLSLRILKVAIKYDISPELIKRLHFFDLQSLILSFNIDFIQQEFKNKRKQRLNERGIDEVEYYKGKNILKIL